jgi:hypothetical protein
MAFREEHDGGGEFGEEGARAGGGDTCHADTKARGGAVVVDLIRSSTTESIFLVALCL